MDWIRLQIDGFTLVGFFASSFLIALFLGPSAKMSIRTHRLQYGACFVAEAALLLCALYLGDWERLDTDVSTKALLAAAMGVQNAASSVWSGGAGRTTHFTGFLADIALTAAFSVRLRRKESGNWWRLTFMPSGWLCFVLGGVCGGVAVVNMGNSALWLSIGFCALAAVWCVTHTFLYQLLGLYTSDTAVTPAGEPDAHTGDVSPSAPVALLEMPTANKPTGDTDDASSAAVLSSAVPVADTSATVALIAEDDEERHFT
jgi:uncharacterized membrane protein YoaK (UPF0700 family)